jgi:hypothetical protein
MLVEPMDETRYEVNAKLSKTKKKKNKSVEGPKAGST